MARRQQRQERGELQPDQGREAVALGLGSVGVERGQAVDQEGAGEEQRGEIRDRQPPAADRGERDDERERAEPGTRAPLGPVDAAEPAAGRHADVGLELGPEQIRGAARRLACDESGVGRVEAQEEAAAVALEPLAQRAVPRVAEQLELALEGVAAAEGFEIRRPGQPACPPPAERVRVGCDPVEQHVEQRQLGATAAHHAPVRDTGEQQNDGDGGRERARELAPAEPGRDQPGAAERGQEQESRAVPREQQRDAGADR